MFRKILETLPFVHHQPPLNMPLRKAVIMSLQRPVDLKQIERFLDKRLDKDGEIVIQQIKDAITYLREKRFFKRDSSNLFVAGLRVICARNPTLGIDFGKLFIPEIPDARAIRTLITYLERTKRFEEVSTILQHSKDNSYSKEKRNKI